MELICPVQRYKWGKKGSHSLVAVLRQNADPKFEINENETYAELWMGTHPNGPAIIKNSDIFLDKWLEKNVSKLGETSVKVFGPKLPFLFKVLSVNLPLSIQVHPSQKEAEELHSKYPDIYKDPNAKPELAIALSDFEALCGFRPVAEIRHFLKLIPELIELIGRGQTDNFLHCSEWEYKERLSLIFGILMKASETEVKKHLDAFLKRVAAAKSDEQKEVLYSLIDRIQNHFPGDVGCFCVYFLNYIKLKSGEAIFLEANQPHAYISGDCIECMAESDNVVRAALTPKLRDVDTLCRILNYTPGDGQSQLLASIEENGYSTLYKPPVREFAVCKVEVGAGLSYNLKCRGSSSIVIVIAGCGKMDDVEIDQGQIFFIGAGEVHKIEVPISSDPLLLFQAFVNV